MSSWVVPRAKTFGYPSPPVAMKSFWTIRYVEPAVRSTAGPVQVPFAACRTTLVTRLPTAAVISYRKQRPDTCGKRPFALGIAETPFSRYVFSSAPLMLYEGAIHMVQSVPYQVEKLDWDGRKAYVTRTHVDYYTDAIDYTKLKVLERFDGTIAGAGTCHHGEVHVVRRVAGYKKIRYYTHENIGYGPVNLPDQEMHTTALWWQLPQQELDARFASRQDALDGFLGAAYALHVVARFGFHVRDAGLLASALARPATTVMGQDAYPGLELKAAALLESAARNHSLLDGNKRTAWTLMVLFLWINGYRHDFDTDTAFDLVVGVADGSVDLRDSSARIAAHLVPRL